ncbi:MAG TPA: hypothetical protein PK668_20840 [Myxococcota bacterium]|nr:hypothetical protein [Myxococcota bacterium]HRY96641.1 hypothetical protein [Myxococcota bacterium]
MATRQHQKQGTRKAKHFLTNERPPVNARWILGRYPRLVRPAHRNNPATTADILGIISSVSVQKIQLDLVIQIPKEVATSMKNKAA